MSQDKDPIKSLTWSCCPHLNSPAFLSLDNLFSLLTLLGCRLLPSHDHRTTTYKVRLEYSVCAKHICVLNMEYLTRTSLPSPNWIHFSIHSCLILSLRSILFDCVCVCSRVPMHAPPHTHTRIHTCTQRPEENT